jgi:hypothetical protein
VKLGKTHAVFVAASLAAAGVVAVSCGYPNFEYDPTLESSSSSSSSSASGAGAASGSSHSSTAMSSSSTGVTPHLACGPAGESMVCAAGQSCCHADVQHPNCDTCFDNDQNCTEKCAGATYIRLFCNDDADCDPSEHCCVTFNMGTFTDTITGSACEASCDAQGKTGICDPSDSQACPQGAACKPIYPGYFVCVETVP